MRTYTPQDWYALATELHDLVAEEMGKAPQKILPRTYQKFTIMYEFYRLIRGEAFHDIRPSGTTDVQHEIYAMENDLAQRLEILEHQLVEEVQ